MSDRYGDEDGCFGDLALSDVRGDCRRCLLGDEDGSAGDGTVHDDFCCAGRCAEAKTENTLPF